LGPERVKDVMTKDLTAVTAATTLAETAHLMAQRRVNGLPVVDGDDKVIGFISESDIIRAAVPAAVREDEMFPPSNFLEMGRRIGSLGQTLVGDLANEPAVSVSEDADFQKLVEIMLGRGYKILPVTRDGCLVGVVNRADVTQALMRDESS
jgi:CBS domain-containing protein